MTTLVLVGGVVGGLVIGGRLVNGLAAGLEDTGPAKVVLKVAGGFLFYFGYGLYRCGRFVTRNVGLTR
jgi:threonine/homoserine/homoserine lactone efflux protein